jgi:hypothetical protein
MERTFTLDEAHELLPILETLLCRAIDGKKKLEAFEAEFESLKSRIMLSGGMLLDVQTIARAKNERDRVVQQVKDALDEIDAAGVQVKDLDTGLLDFPWVNDPEVLLCWKLGEKRITHWHNTSEGFRGRKPIDDRIAKARRQ